MGTFNAKRLESAIKKTGLTIEVRENRRYVTGPINYGSYFIQGDLAVCVSTCRNGDAPDGMYDHFPQTFQSTIKRFVSSLTRGMES